MQAAGEDDTKSIFSSIAATSRHSRWGKAKSRLAERASNASAAFALAARSRVDEVLHQIETECRENDNRMPVITRTNQN